MEPGDRLAEILALSRGTSRPVRRPLVGAADRGRRRAGGRRRGLGRAPRPRGARPGWTHRSDGGSLRHERDPDDGPLEPGTVLQPLDRHAPRRRALAALPVYYPAPIGDDARMVRLYREWLTAPGVTRDAAEQARARAALELAMGAVPAGTDGYLEPWRGVDLVDVAVTTDRITVTLSGPGTTSRPADTERVAVQQLVWTAQAAVGRGNLPVRFVLADGSDAMFGSQPVDRTYLRPASRDELYEDLAPIWVTSPTRGQVLPAGAVTVEGEASVFEATVSWELRRGGEVVDSGFETATRRRPGSRDLSRSASAPWRPGRTRCGCSS